MTDFLLLLFVDIVLGYIPQAIGYAICLFTLTNQPLRSNRFLIICVIYSVFEMAGRLAFNLGLVNFGFHSVIIWMLFILVAILYNKAPVLRSTISILISGILVTVSEVINVVALKLVLGDAALNEIMNNTATNHGKMVKAACGIPTNVLFLIIVLVAYFVVKKKRSKMIAPAEEEEAQA